MKRTRFLALALVVAVMMMGAGYAWWNDTLQVKGSIDTGEFNVFFKTEGGTTPTKPSYSVHTDSTNYMQADIYYANDNTFTKPTSASSLVAHPKFAKLSVTNIYPGAYANFDFKIKNGSTMAVKYNGISFPTGSAPDFTGTNLENYLKFNATITHHKNGGTSTAISSVTGGLVKDLATELNTDIGTTRLEPGEEVHYDIKVYLDGNTPNDHVTNGLTESQLIEFVLQSDFVQYNNQTNHY